MASYFFGAKNETRFHDSARFSLEATLLLSVIAAGIYILLSQPSVDVLTIIVCLLSYKSMKRIARQNMNGV